MTNTESTESTSEEIDPSKVQERKEKIKDILSKLSPTNRDKAYAILNGEQRFEEILISGFNNKDEIAAILIEIKNLRKSEVQAAKQAQEKAEADEKLVREKRNADMARMPVILKNDFTFNETQVKEIMEIINCQTPENQNYAKMHFIMHIFPANKTKPVSFDTVKEMLNNFLGNFIGNVNPSDIVNMWKYGEVEKDLLYDSTKYKMTKTETRIVKHDKNGMPYDEVICYSPVAITKLQENTDDGKIYYDAEFFTVSGAKKLLNLPMNELCSSKGIPKLVGCGLSVPEKQYSNCGELFMNLANLNDNNIIKIKMYNSFGWKDDCSKFFIGEVIYTLDSAGNIVKSGASLAKAEQYEKYVKALIPHGTVEGWFEGNKLVLRFISARFAVYEGIASILNYPLAQQSRMSNIWDTSSSGKSTILCLVLSMFGYPGVKSGGKGLLYSGDTTAAAFEDFAKLMMDIIVSLDETKLMKQEELAKLMLKYGNQMVRGRSTAGGGMRKESQSWRGNCLATSESPLHAENALEGEMIRAYDFNDSLGEKTEESLAAVEAFEATEKIHYGQVGLVIIERVMKMNKSGELQNLYLKTKAEMLTRYKKENPDYINSISFVNRVLDSFAAFAVGGAIFESLMKEHNLPESDSTDICYQKMSVIIRNIAKSSYELRVLENIYNWIEQYQANFTVNGTGDTKIFFGNYDSVHKLIKINKNALIEHLKKYELDLAKATATLTKYRIILTKKEDGARLWDSDNKSYLPGIIIDVLAAKQIMYLDNPFVNAEQRIIQKSVYGKQMLEQGIAKERSFEMKSVNGTITKVFNDEGKTINQCDDEIPDIRDEIIQRIVPTPAEAKVLLNNYDEPNRILAAIE
jgi:hypothetical protein